MQTLPSQPLRRVFCCPKHGSIEIARRKPERETRIPGLAPQRRVPKSAGPVGGNEAQAGYRWQSELQGVRACGAVPGVAQEISLHLVCRIPRLNQTLVVKISDTSRRKKRVRIPPVMPAPWSGPERGTHAPRAPVTAERQQPAQAITDADIACSPACCFQLPVREHRARRW